MKTQNRYLGIISLAILLLVLLGALSVTGPPTFAIPAAELHVCPPGPLTCDYTTIQAAVDAANAGDVIKVSAGTYAGVQTIDMHTQHLFINKPLTVAGGYNPSDWENANPALYPTILDAQASGRVVYVDGGHTVTLAGLKLTMGDAAGQGGGEWDEDAGGGLYADGGTIVANDCWFSANTARAGGGAYIKNGDLSLTGSRFTNNRARTNSSGSYGDGGGLLLNHTSAYLERNHFMANTAGYAGSAIFAGFNSVVSMVNDALVVNEIDDNPPYSYGCAVFAAGSTIGMTHSTVTGNLGGNGIGICADSWPSASTIILANGIVANQVVGIDAAPGSSATVDGVLWYANGGGNTTGAVTIDHAYTGDPMFMGDGYHLTEGSAAIDKGIDAGVANDIDKQSRPQGFGPDLGADEFQLPATSTPTSTPTFTVTPTATRTSTAVSIPLYLPLVLK